MADSWQPSSLASRKVRLNCEDLQTRSETFPCFVGTDTREQERAPWASKINACERGGGLSHVDVSVQILRLADPRIRSGIYGR
jgi:hypothetical protein